MIPFPPTLDRLCFRFFVFSFFKDRKPRETQFKRPLGNYWWNVCFFDSSGGFWPGIVYSLHSDAAVSLVLKCDCNGVVEQPGRADWCVGRRWRGRAWGQCLRWVPYHVFISWCMCLELDSQKATIPTYPNYPADSGQFWSDVPTWGRSSLTCWDKLSSAWRWERFEVQKDEERERPRRRHRQRRSSQEKEKGRTVTDRDGPDETYNFCPWQSCRAWHSKIPLRLRVNLGSFKISSPDITKSVSSGVDDFYSQ